MHPPDPERQLTGFIRKFAPAHQRLIRAVRTSLQLRMPTAFELVYDNYNFLVIGYGPTERPSDAIVSLVAGANGVSLCFINGAHLPDPHGVLSGAGKQTRFMRLESAAALERAGAEALLAAAVANSDTPLLTSGGGRLTIRSVSARQRPRRSPAKNAGVAEPSRI
jgi:hypothetical protein